MEQSGTLQTQLRSARPLRERSSGLPEDLLRKAAGRLRVVALVFSFGFLIANFVPPIFEPTGQRVFGSVLGWGPGAFSIAMGLMVAGLASTPRIRPGTLMNIGMVFGVLGSFGIAAASYWGIYAGLDHNIEHLNLLDPGYVAPWIIAYTVLIPNRPGRALFAGLVSASAVPIMWLLTMKFGGTTISLAPGHFFTALVLPYLLVVMMAYVGAQLVYSLGTDVKNARRLGSYELVERLGSGGMGEVWRARHRMLARPAAIKVVRPEALAGGTHQDQRTLLRRFEREAQMTALMRSPHTVDLYDFGVAENGTVYYVMELLEGFGSSRPGNPLRTDTLGTGRPYHAPGVRFAGGSPSAGTHSSRRQGRQPLPVSLRSQCRFHQGAGLWSGHLASRWA